MKVTIRIDPRQFPATGYEVERSLCERFQIQVEMADAETVLVLIKPGITRGDIDYFVLSLQQMQIDMSSLAPLLLASLPNRQCRWQTILYPYQAFHCAHRLHPLSAGAGEICWGSIFAYPPGIPLVMPGECLTQEIIDYLEELIRLGAIVKGITPRGEVLVCESALIHPSTHPFRRQRRSIKC